MSKSEGDIQELRADLEKCISKQIQISKEVLCEIKNRFQPQRLNIGEKFIEPGRICRRMAFIQDGTLRMFNYADGEEITLWIGSKNRFITDLRSFIYNKAARWYIEAVEPSTLLTITRDDHNHLINNYHEWIEFDNRLLTNAYTIIEERMFSHLYMSAEERFNMLLKTDPELFNKVPLKQIASMLAMTPETLSRLRAKKTS